MALAALVLVGFLSSGAQLAEAGNGDSPPRALDVLSLITVENERGGDGYDRSAFAEGLDVDGDGCATRGEVLIRDALIPAQVDVGCDVLTGEWRSVYDGVMVTDPASLDVDHVVALKEAWQSGRGNGRPTVGLRSPTTSPIVGRFEPSPRPRIDPRATPIRRIGCRLTTRSCASSWPIGSPSRPAGRCRWISPRPGAFATS